MSVVLRALSVSWSQYKLRTTGVSGQGFSRKTVKRGPALAALNRPGAKIPVKKPEMHG
jgi:hypothetical protein